MLANNLQEKIKAILEQKNFQISGDSFVIFPEKVSDLIKIVKLANKNDFKINTFGFGNSFTKDNSNLENTVYVSTTKFNGILETDLDNLFIRVESGMNLSKLLNLLKEQNLFLPVKFLNEISHYSLGGFFSTIKPESIITNYVKGVEFISPTGEIITYGCKTLKNVAGYDLTKLVLGSFGKFGIVTSYLLKLSISDKFFFEVENCEDIRMRRDYYNFNDDENIIYNNLKENLDPNNVLI